MEKESSCDVFFRAVECGPRSCTYGLCKLGSGELYNNKKVNLKRVQCIGGNVLYKNTL